VADRVADARREEVAAGWANLAQLEFIELCAGHLPAVEQRPLANSSFAKM
jgi:hypothetical protein